MDRQTVQTLMTVGGPAVGIGADITTKAADKPHISWLDVSLTDYETATHIVEFTSRDILMPLGIFIGLAGFVWKLYEWRQKR